MEIIQEATLASERADKVAEELQEELATLTDNRITNHYAPAVIAAWQPNAQAAARRAAT